MEIRTAFVQEIYTECEIDAPADKVYVVISDFSGYPAWTNDITVSGDTNPGGNMRVRVKTKNGGEGWYTLSSKMRRNDNRMIAFVNALVSPFLFLGRHRFEIVPISDGRTLFVNAEVFSGLMIHLVREKSLLRATRRFKENVNLALKNAVESA